MKFPSRGLIIGWIEIPVDTAWSKSLRFGVSPPTPDWGLMISNARGLMSFAYWAVIAPIVGLSSLIIGINLTADAFAKALGIDRSTKAPV